MFSIVLLLIGLLSVYFAFRAFKSKHWVGGIVLIFVVLFFVGGGYTVATQNGSNSSQQSVQHKRRTNSAPKKAVSSSSSSFLDSQDIRSKFDVNNMDKYSSSDLSVDANLSNFYVKAVNHDKLGSYHYLLTPSSSSNSYFLIVQDKKIKGAKVGHTISVDGYLNGKGNVNMGDKASPYQGKKCVLFMTD